MESDRQKTEFSSIDDVTDEHESSQRISSGSIHSNDFSSLVDGKESSRIIVRVREPQHLLILGDAIGHEVFQADLWGSCGYWRWRNRLKDSAIVAIVRGHRRIKLGAERFRGGVSGRDGIGTKDASGTAGPVHVYRAACSVKLCAIVVAQAWHFRRSLVLISVEMGRVWIAFRAQESLHEVGAGGILNPEAFEQSLLVRIGGRGTARVAAVISTESISCLLGPCGIPTHGMRHDGR